MKSMRYRMGTFLIVATAGAAFGAWQQVPMPPVEYGITKMEFANEGLGYALGNDPHEPANALCYGGGAWGSFHFPGMFEGTAVDISLLPSGYGWAVGDHYGISHALYTGRSYGGGSWTAMSNPYQSGPMPGGLRAVSVAAPEDVWILFDTPAVLHYKDGIWEYFPNALPSQVGYVVDISSVNPNDGWVAGSGGLAHYQSGTWTFAGGPAANHLDFTAADDGWAVDYDGPNVYHYNGSSWTAVFSVAGYKASRGSFCDRGNGWAAFYSTHYSPTWRLFKYENSNWREVTPPQAVASPSSVNPYTCWFLGGTTAGYTSWRWDTQPNIESTTLGRIKAAYK